MLVFISVFKQLFLKDSCVDFSVIAFSGNLFGGTSVTIYLVYF